MNAPTRTYEVRHRTRYTYSDTVSSSYGRAYVLPRDAPGQWCRSSSLEVDPVADLVSEHTDAFGNRSSYLEVHTKHRQLVVTATSLVDVTRVTPDLAALDTATWEETRDRLRRDGHAHRVGTSETGMPAPLTPGRRTPPDDWTTSREFLLASPLVPLGGALTSLADSVFVPGRPLGETLRDLVRRIHDEFTYKAGATTVSTPLAEVVARRAGVCQDFAHLAVGCLRMAGLPARYVSGYVETRPPPGKPKLQGADASHAWASVLVPTVGWIDLDPTNDQAVGPDYVMTAWGRDYADVPPLKGVIFTEAKTSTLVVEVDVLRRDLPA